MFICVKLTLQDFSVTRLVALAGVPSLVGEDELHLDDPKENLTLLSFLKKKEATAAGKVLLRTNEALNFQRTGTQSGSIFAEYEDRLVIYIKYRFHHYSFLPVSSIMQTFLWKDSELPITYMFSSSLFFDVMMKQSNALLTDPLAVLSDQVHIEYGREFWKRRTHEALAKGLNVAQVDFGKQSYQSITDPLELEELLNKYLGKAGSSAEGIKLLPWLIWVK